jgi:hypothetical protein
VLRNDLVLLLAVLQFEVRSRRTELAQVAEWEVEPPQVQRILV